MIFVLSATAQVYKGLKHMEEAKTKLPTRNGRLKYEGDRLFVFQLGKSGSN